MKSVCCLVLLSLGATALQAALENPTQIVEKGEKQLRGASSQFVMRMEIDHSAYRRDLQLRSWAVGKEKSLVAIVEPAKESGITSLRLQNQMWNFFPKTDQTVRIPSSVMLQSWMGSDFTNDDLMKLSSLTTDYTHKLLRKEKYRGEATQVIECTPKADAPVVWGKILYWARSSDSLPVKEEYYDEKSKLVRTLSLSEFKKMDDRVIPTVMRIQSAENPTDSTTIRYEKVLFDRKIADSFFEKEKLREVSQTAKNMSRGWYELP